MPLTQIHTNPVLIPEDCDQGRLKKADEGQQTGATIAHGTNTPEEEEEVKQKL